jgi:hypothetical protein
VTPSDIAQPVGPHGSASADPLEFRAATKRYAAGGAAAVDALTLDPSGCGKTTAMRMVNRMIEIAEGRILLGGVSVRARREADLRRHIGDVIQQIGLFPHRTTGEHIATVPRLPSSSLAWFGAGFVNVMLALALLAIPPILTNTYVGMREVEREIVDAGRGMGMGPWRLIRTVELPLAPEGVKLSRGTRRSRLTVINRRVPTTP